MISIATRYRDRRSGRKCSLQPRRNDCVKGTAFSVTVVKRVEHRCIHNLRLPGQADLWSRSTRTPPTPFRPASPAARPGGRSERPLRRCRCRQSRVSPCRQSLYGRNPARLRVWRSVAQTGLNPASTRYRNRWSPLRQAVPEPTVAQTPTRPANPPVTCSNCCRSYSVSRDPANVRQHDQNAATTYL